MSLAPAAAVLVVAGIDSSGGAGLVRDVQVLAEHGIGALCAVTAVTAQTHGALLAVEPISPALVRRQIEAALAAAPVRAIKIGMLATRGIAAAVAAALPPRERIPVVLDPVVMSSSGGRLCDEGGLEVLRNEVIPRATLLTPNLPEAALLLGEAGAADGETAILERARRLLALGAEAVLLKGGHGRGELALDVLATAGGGAMNLEAPRVAANLRGTGCMLSSAVAAGLARGMPLEAACAAAKRYVSEKLHAERRAGAAAVRCVAARREERGI